MREAWEAETSEALPPSLQLHQSMTRKKTLKMAGKDARESAKAPRRSVAAGAPPFTNRWYAVIGPAPHPKEGDWKNLPVRRAMVRLELPAGKAQQIPQALGRAQVARAVAVLALGHHPWVGTPTDGGDLGVVLRAQALALCFYSEVAKEYRLAHAVEHAAFGLRVVAETAGVAFPELKPSYVRQLLTQVLVCAADEATEGDVPSGGLYRAGHPPARGGDVASIKPLSMRGRPATGHTAA